MIEDMTPREMYKMLKDAKADIMLSGGRSQFVALKATMPWLDINQERHHRLYGLCRHGRAGRGDRQDAVQSRLGNRCASPRPGRSPAKTGRSARWRRSRRKQAELAADPVKAEAGAPRETRVHVQGRALGAIEDAIRDGPIHREGVQEKTNASGGCGACAIRIEEILRRARLSDMPTQQIDIAAE